MNYVDPTKAGSKDYEKELREIEATGECPFCQGNMKWHSRPIIIDKKGWFATENQRPYKNAKIHILLICKKHKTEFSELTSEDLGGVLVIIKELIAKFDIQGGGLTIRFGKTQYTGATVKHLHFHLIVPEINNNDVTLQVNFPIG